MEFADSVPQLNRAPRPTPYTDSAHEEHGCDPQSVRTVQGVLMGVALGALMWVSILWLVL